jgi:L-serine dehydratase
MAPRFAAEAFAKALPRHTARVRITLFGSLAATGRGHLTDIAVTQPFGQLPVELIWKPDEILPEHPNGLRFEAMSADGDVVSARTLFSIGGGALREEGAPLNSSDDVYPYRNMSDILRHAEDSESLLWELVLQHEGDEILTFLAQVWHAMQEAIARGLNAEGRLPGDLRLPRKASSYYAKAMSMSEGLKSSALVFAFALAVAEENADGGIVVTAPTCGASGVLPAVLNAIFTAGNTSEDKIIRALATAGLVGNVVKQNGSISGAEVGCQGEIGTACAMAAAAAAQLFGGTPRQIEYAAEMGLEHHLGLTCDPIGGYVQIPCIERNAMAAIRAIDCALYALLSDGKHIVSFDEAVIALLETGRDISANYRETALGGLAKVHFARRR